MLQLRIEKGNQEVQDPTVAVGWCIDRETRQELFEKKIENPQVLLIVVPEGGGARTEVRFLAPLEQLMTYISFHKSGRHIIYGTIVLSSSSRDVRKRFLSKDYDKTYSCNLLDSEGELSARRVGNAGFLLEYAEIEAVVPQGVFGKEPSAWEKQWVNFLFDPAVDQCEYRKQRMFAYTIQPILAVALLGLFTLAYSASVLVPSLALFLCGYRLPKKFLTIPLEGGGLTPSRIWKDISFNDSMFVMKWHHSGKRYLFHSTFLFVPPLVLLVCGVSSIRLGWDGALVGGITLTSVAVAFFIIELLSHLDGAFRVSEEQRQQKKPAVEFMPSYYKDSLILCETALSVPSLGALPKERRTFYLRFQELKRKVCRPFAY